MSVTGYKFTALTGGAAGALDSQDGAGLVNGDLAVVMMSGVLRLYELDDDSGAAESSPTVIPPATNAGAKRWIEQRVPATSVMPVGSIVAFIGGYIAAGGLFTNVIGDTAAVINALVNGDGWYVCNGAALNLAGSSIFNGTGRYLPNLADQRFLMGHNTAGIYGGTNSNSHTHSTGNFTLTINEIPSHMHPTFTYNSGGATPPVTLYGTHSVGYDANGIATTWNIAYPVGGGATHNHGTTGSSSTSDNMPQFLSCWYLMKAI